MSTTFYARMSMAGYGMTFRQLPVDLHGGYSFAVGASQRLSPPGQGEAGPARPATTLDTTRPMCTGAAGYAQEWRLGTPALAFPKEPACQPSRYVKQC